MGQKVWRRNVLPPRMNDLPVQIFLCHPVVLLSYISRFALLLQQVDSNTTGTKKNESGLDQYD